MKKIFLNPEKLENAVAVLSENAIISPLNDGYGFYILGEDALRNMKSWDPYCYASMELVPDTVKNEFGEIIIHKSSFKIGDWYINLGEGDFDFDYMESKWGVKIERI